MASTLEDKIKECLKQTPRQLYTSRDIAIWISETYPDWFQEKAKLSAGPKETITQIVAEILSRRNRLRDLNIKITEDRPRKWYYTELSDSEEVYHSESTSTAGDTSDKAAIKEIDLYPILEKFLLSELGIRSKRIDEKRSRNSRDAGGNEWLHPDLVGMEDLSREWHLEIKNCVKQHADKKTKLWSFEVKILVNHSNVRKAFFQAVGNSSWANFGYLVAHKIAGASTLKELRLLSALHGIGFIKLDVENPSESEIMIPAKERVEIDWNVANRLTTENKDFLDYIKLVSDFGQTGRASNAGWDAQSTKN